MGDSISESVFPLIKIRFSITLKIITRNLKVRNSFCVVKLI